MAVTLPLPAGVNVSVGSGLEERANIRKAPFGDGYMQRSRAGRNWIRGAYSVTIENLTRAERIALFAFFRTQGGDLPFEFTVPGEATARLWTCEVWRLTHVGTLHETVACTFDEQFDPT